MDFKNKGYWALILGGSSGFGLATAKKLSKHGMNICIVHRDRKGSMQRIEEGFNEIKKNNVKFESFNLDALSEEGRKTVITELKKILGNDKIKLLLHSIAFGNLKLLAPQVKKDKKKPSDILADKLGIPKEKLQETLNELFENGNDEFIQMIDPPQYMNELFLEDEDFANTIYSMGSSFSTWVSEVFRNQLFSKEASVIGLTSEGNEVAIRGYAAVSAAKVTLEAISRSIALEYAPYGIRSNIIQAGVTETPALKLIPGSKHMAAYTRLRNPMGRGTTPEDVANFIALMCTDEAVWVNGEIIRVDGGERIVG